jgi:type IV pilus assembly protein PilQ
VPTNEEKDMCNWTKTAGLIFLATASVYFDSASVAGPARPANSAAPEAPSTEVKLLEETDPFADPVAAAATSQPVAEGTSVSDSEVKVSDAGTVEIHVNDASLVEVLRMLSLQSQKNIVASKDVRGTVTANLYDVTVREALDAILHANGYAYREKGNFIYVYTAKELEAIEKATRVMETRVFKLYYTPAANAVNMIKPVLSDGSQTAITTPTDVGVEKSLSDLGGDSHATNDMIVVTDFPENLEKVAEIIKELDARPQQILVEATIVRAALKDDNALGVDFTILGGVDFSGLTAAGSNVNSALNGNILNQPSAGQIVDNGYNAVGTGFASAVPNGGLKVGVVYNDIAVFISALEQVTDTIVLANPKVLAVNRQVAEVHVGNNDGYLTTTTTESSTVQTVEFLETGTKLMFRPFIGDDGYIRMEVHPEDSNGGLSSAGLPFKSTTEVTSQVMVKDGHTIVIGGLFRESSTSTRGQVPGLGNIPIAGVLFRNQRDQTHREEVIILLTPHIVKDEKVFSQLSEEEKNKAEKLRVGLRQGMMWFGRERLAESSYEKAVAELDKPNPDRKKALWYLSCATNLNPMFIEAIDLKQKITGVEVTTSDNSTIRSFVKRMILADVPPAPTDAEPSASDATTQPFAEVPSTQPFAEVPSTQPVAGAPATQPVTVEVAAAEEPATQPVAAVETEVTSIDESTITEIVSLESEPLSEESDGSESSYTGPTTAPVVELDAGFVTELPSDDSYQESFVGEESK